MTSLVKANGAWSIAPQSLGELMQFSKLIADSELVPKDYRGKPGNVVIAIQMGADVGLSPMQAIQSIAVINGRASMWGDTLLALVQAHADFEDIQERVESGVATCTLKLRGRQPTVRTFSRDDAKRAGLLGKQGPWTQHENRMLQMRARGFALRDGAAYILRGFTSAEEQRDIIEAKASFVEPPPRAHEPPKQLASDTPVTDAMQTASDIANTDDEPKPDPHAVYWFKGNKHTGKSLDELEAQSLTNYITRLEKALKDDKWAAAAEPYYQAALAELDRRRVAEADAAGADPETGELLDDEFLDQDAGAVAP